ncbi:hypothetical protein B0H14DRAFT_2817521 [Mycena olivaceomarginata]|nr:hypothetical protein B0H14DRAFT_2817521 [Mycena olivaceomarginata]
MASECSPSGGPQMNTDISGIGVRVSFYLQTLFLSCLCARSGSPDEIVGALYTLLFTNTAMAVTVLILGFQRNPEITFHDGLIVFYLLNLSWVTVVYVSLPVVAKFPNVKLLHVFSVVQSYTIFAFAFTMLISAHSFGRTPDCNSHAVVVLFHPFPALPAGRILCLVLTAFFFTVYTGILIKDHLPPDAETHPPVDPAESNQRGPRSGPGASDRTARGAPQPRPAPPRFAAGRVEYHARKPPAVPKEYDLQIEWPLVIEILVVLILWGLTVMNTELLISLNHFAPSDGGHSSWQFGQVLPMFLVVLPLANLITAFRDYGLRKNPTSQRT